MSSLVVETLHGPTYCELYGKSNLTSGKPCLVIILVHGLGGTVGHWRDSDVAKAFADEGNFVICFDWYSHGKSAQLPSSEIAHDVDLFINQLREVIHSEALGIAGQKYCIHGFSMGCFLTVNYLATFEDNRVHKVVLQSPWDGKIPKVLKGLIRTPGLLRLFKPHDMAGIKSVKTLKQILLKIGKKYKWNETLVRLKESNDKYPVVVMAGTREPPFMSIAKQIHSCLGDDRSEFLRLKRAGHMSFLYKKDKTVGRMVRGSWKDIHAYFEETESLDDEDKGVHVIENQKESVGVAA